MCKISIEDKKIGISCKCRKKKKSFKVINILEKSGLLLIKDDSISIRRRERSRIAAQERRDLETQGLKDLYRALPVPPQSRLLSDDDSLFIGNFEKATIIKVCAYALKLYNSLSDSSQLNFLYQRHLSTVSLFSQSFFGLFWCQNSMKLVFTTPGLARLTGLFWCNMIGMPISSIVVDYGEGQTFSEPFHMLSLRFMMNSLKDRGIFTVQPPADKKSKNNHHNDKASATTSAVRKEMIGKIPCSVWSSGRLNNEIQFALIQPLVTAMRSTKKIIRIEHSNPSIDRVQTNDDFFDESKVSYTSFSSYHLKDMFRTVAVDEDFLTSLGYRKEDVDNTIIYSFICLSDIVLINDLLNKLLAGYCNRKHALIKVGTGKKGVYRWALVTMHWDNDPDISISDIINSRSNLNQGEAFSQNVVEALNNMKVGSDGNESSSEEDQSKWILKVTYDLKGYYPQIIEETFSISRGLVKQAQIDSGTYDEPLALVTNRSIDTTAMFQSLIVEPTAPEDPVVSSAGQKQVYPDPLELTMHDARTEVSLPTITEEYFDNNDLQTPPFFSIEANTLSTEENTFLKGLSTEENAFLKGLSTEENPFQRGEDTFQFPSMSRSTSYRMALDSGDISDAPNFLRRRFPGSSCFEEDDERNEDNEYRWRLLSSNKHYLNIPAPKQQRFPDMQNFCNHNDAVEPMSYIDDEFVGSRIVDFMPYPEMFNPQGNQLGSDPKSTITNEIELDFLDLERQEILESLGLCDNNQMFHKPKPKEEANVYNFNLEKQLKPCSYGFHTRFQCLKKEDKRDKNIRKYNLDTPKSSPPRQSILLTELLKPKDPSLK